MHIVGKMLRVKDTEPIAFIKCNTLGRNIEK